MNFDALQVSILAAPLVAGALVTATHVPLGMQVLKRGIVFIDLAVAQIAGVGVILATWLGFEPEGAAVQVSALIAALTGALFLTWTERRWPQVQEATIGVSFVLASTAAILLLANNPHGGEHLRDLLAGQILLVSASKLPLAAVGTLILLVAWFGLRERLGRAGFYVLFACAVTLSMQLVGLYLVFSTLIIPALATHQVTRRRLPLGYAVSALGYALGLILSAITDLPSGALIVWSMFALALVVYVLTQRRAPVAVE
jgi:zinc/manganese transport system permease protein